MVEKTINNAKDRDEEAHGTGRMSHHNQGLFKRTASIAILSASIMMFAAGFPAKARANVPETVTTTQVGKTASASERNTANLHSTETLTIPNDTINVPGNNLQIIAENFNQYSPKTSRETITLDDALLQTYLTENLPSYNTLDLNVMFNEHFSGSSPKNLNNQNISNMPQFKKIVYETIDSLARNDAYIGKILPKGHRGIKELSINDAVYLSGKIVASRMSYDERMVGSNSQNPNETAKGLLQDLANGTDSRDSTAKKIDSENANELITLGEGVCRNYAELNVAIFNLLKKENKNLRNTYMTTYQPESLARKASMQHEWNRVVTLYKADGKTEISMSFIDPTFLDYYKLNKETKQEAYNAFDSKHFSEKGFYEKLDLAGLLNALGSTQRTQEGLTKPQFLINKKAAKAYQDAAFGEYVNVLKDAVKTKDFMVPIIVENAMYSISELPSEIFKADAKDVNALVYSPESLNQKLEQIRQIIENNKEKIGNKLIKLSNLPGERQITLNDFGNMISNYLGK